MVLDLDRGFLRNVFFLPAVKGTDAARDFGSQLQPSNCVPNSLGP